MIGHTKCTAGAAGLVKVAMALSEKVLPPTLHVQTPNPKMEFADSPFFVNAELRPWIARPDGIPRRAGVSAFGFGGTNFHVVLEEYADDPAGERRAPIAQNWPSEMLVWSAESPGALRAMLSDLIRGLDGGAEPSLAELGWPDMAGVGQAWRGACSGGRRQQSCGPARRSWRPLSRSSGRGRIDFPLIPRHLSASAIGTPGAGQGCFSLSGPRVGQTWPRTRALFPGSSGRVPGGSGPAASERDS